MQSCICGCFRLSSLSKVVLPKMNNLQERNNGQQQPPPNNTCMTAGYALSVDFSKHQFIGILVCINMNILITNKDCTNESRTTPSLMRFYSHYHMLTIFANKHCHHVWCFFEEHSQRESCQLCKFYSAFLSICSCKLQFNLIDMPVISHN